MYHGILIPTCTRNVVCVLEVLFLFAEVQRSLTMMLILSNSLKVWRVMKCSRRLLYQCSSEMFLANVEVQFINKFSPTKNCDPRNCCPKFSLPTQKCVSQNLLYPKILLNPKNVSILFGKFSPDMNFNFCIFLEISNTFDTFPLYGHRPVERLSPYRTHPPQEGSCQINTLIYWRTTLWFFSDGHPSKY